MWVPVSCVQDKRKTELGRRKERQGGHRGMGAGRGEAAVLLMSHQLPAGQAAQWFLLTQTRTRFLLGLWWLEGGPPRLQRENQGGIEHLDGAELTMPLQREPWRSQGSRRWSARGS